MRNQMKKISMMLLVFVLAFGLMAVTASAAKKVPVKKLKNLKYSDSYGKIKKNATTVKRGTYTLKFGKTGRGYVKYKVPKTKTYTFTLSNLKSKNTYSSGWVSMYTPHTYKYLKKTYLDLIKCKTQGGAMFSAYVGTYNSSSTDLKYRNLTSRYMKKKLKKGQTVFLYFSFYSGNAITLSIK